MFKQESKLDKNIKKYSNQKEEKSNNLILYFATSIMTIAFLLVHFYV